MVYTVDLGSNAVGDDLSVMCKSTLNQGICLVNSDRITRYVLAYCGADLPDHGMDADRALTWKDAIVAERLRVQVPIVRVRAASTIKEALNVREALAQKGIRPKRIVLIAEWWHSWRVGVTWRRAYFWQWLFGGCQIEVRTIPWIESDDYILPTMRRKWKWALFNMVGLAIVLFLGITLAQRLKQPAPRR